MSEKQDFIEVYTKGIKAWFPDKEEGWVSATCVSNTVEGDKITLKFIDDSAEKEHVFESTLTAIKKSNGSNLPPLRNPPKMEYTDDLTNLSYLNEPSVLNTIRTRYMQHLIYTYSGIVLIAVNPFDRVPLYESDIVQQYSGKRRGELEPHLFAIAEEAYRCMIREQRNQTIVVSGESGAGKTVSAKYIMRYFATADDQESTGKVKKDSGSLTEVEEQILATNPIMEAFGNAKTTRNDNSSRFGKYIEIQFDGCANIVGAKIRTYLLERSRLIFQPETERNYHIFYQLCAGVPSQERKEFELNDYAHFHYLNQSGTGEIPGVDDKQEFDLTQKALSTVGLSVDLQWKIFRLLSALLHIGNINITGRNDALLSDTDPALATSSRLLGINADEFRKWIVKKQIITRSEKIVTNLTPVQANVVRDSVAKYIYSNLFDWLVGVINESLSCPDEQSTVKNFIGVLDIYGFEHFKQNSFEQFCINYANEKLQQQFNQHVFKLEQEEYMREKINWTFIEFSDNQKCIEMIEGRLGILSLLDEESRLPAGTDQAFCQKLYDHFATSEHKNYFKKPRFSNQAFTIEHYAHEVQYEAENFLEKNKDSLPDEHLEMLRNSEFNFLEEILSKSLSAAQAMASTDNKRKSMISRKPTLGSIFKNSLINLMATIGNTNVHYIRCIKPNEAKVAWEFDGPMVLSQLRACGVLETIRISCLGYPSRWTFEEFAERYYALVPSKQWETNDIRSLCQLVLDSCIKDTDKYQIGETKIFFRAGQLAYMEKLRSDRYDACAIVLQKNMRRFVYRRRYVRLQALIVQLQCLARQKLATHKLQELRQNKAAIIIQTNFRRYIAHKSFVSKKDFIIRLQTAIRSRQTRKIHKSLQEHHAAIQIQRHARGMLARKWYKSQIAHIVLLQSCIRRRTAQKQLVTLRLEAKSANHFKEVSYKLENKVVELNQMIATLKAEKTASDQKAVHLEAQLQHTTERYEKMEKSSKEVEHSLKELKTSYELLQEEHDKVKSEHASTLEKVQKLTKETNVLKEQLEKEKMKLQQQKEKAKPTKDENASEVAELKQQITALKAQLARAMHSTRKQDSLSPARNGNRTLSPSPMRGRQPSFSAEEPLKQTTLLTNRKTRRNSSIEVGAVGAKSSIDRIRLAEELSNGKTPRPTSLGLYGINGQAGRLNTISGDPEEEINSILRQEEPLQEEILSGLVRSLKIPLPSTKNPPSLKEIVFPAHIIGLCVKGMWRIGYHRESENLVFAVIDAIHKQCLTFNGEDAFVPCSFWLTNTHELLSTIIQTEQQFQKELQERGHSISWRELEKLTQDIKHELQCLEDNIYQILVKEIKKRYSKMVIPAVIESQSLPGFITNDSGRFLNRLFMTHSEPAYNMDDLLAFLHKVYKTMTCYSIEPSAIRQVLTEVLKMTGTMSFNDLLMRKNFSSWKRAMQIQYNISRIEEWCKKHDIPEGVLQLEHLTQATKLLQLKKASLEDIENIYDVCWVLSPTQIQKLISQYHLLDYETPIKPEILKEVANRVISGGNNVLLLDLVPLDMSAPFEIPSSRKVTEYLYLPAWMQLKRLRQLIQLEAALDETKRNEVIVEEPGNL